ncbi:type VI secretion system Vgr family protein [Pseudomonas sp. PSKL.D1]|uniref:type VI secretion system Vgr family protein n=1 Tax=Pseudomonas sp. PSKL.D1 TaxID=3029060 RepID=UPI00238126A8|nr:type VI secretion system tip protein TssI/VgrG [Pseudomonas sp. PSKL.D1]WDY56302.1 type VI secretion system tip protein TssI/VgrG [Pseudomonas sp. PSKL.D1]
MPNQSDLRYSFTPLVGGDYFEVVSFSLTEALSKPFRLELELISFENDINFGHLLDKPVLFTVWRDERPVRYVHGLVSSFSLGESGFCRTRYKAVVEPQLARAALRSNWRIFQHKTVPQILELMLKRQAITQYEFGISFTAQHPAREFCVQAGETDLDFIARLAAEEGFVYRFEHTPKHHKLLITDRLLAMGLLTRGAIKAEDEDEGFYDDDGAPVDPDSVLYHSNSGGQQPRPCLQRLRYSEQVRTARQVQRDYTFRHPRYRQEHVAAGPFLEHQSSDYERFDYPGRYKRDAVGKVFTENRAIALRHDARIAEVEGDDIRLQPGLAFTLQGHPRDDLNMLWRVTRITHEGAQFTSLQEEAANAVRGTHYTQTATLVPGMAEWRPEPLPKPRIDGPHMATVVGPPNEEIFCDEWGRVKVSFPWDRESRDNQFSSCWVRVSQGWAGGSWGAMAIPRIGQDVIIQYVNADPDQPIITGRTYCGNQLPPYELPKHKTRMTIKSQTHLGKGFNELRFEDELGQEEVYIHAQKDQNNEVGNDETTQIGRNRVEQVGNDEQLRVGNDLQQENGRDRIHSIGRDHQVSVGNDLVEHVVNNRSESTQVDHHVSVGGNSELIIKGQQQVTVGQGMSQQTTVFRLQASERIEFLSPGGSIVLDAEGITLNGLTLTLLGKTEATKAGSGNTGELDFKPEESHQCEETSR